MIVSEIDLGAALTHPGAVRENNEDAVLLTNWGGATLAAIADGMGGYGGGDVAARLAIDSFTKLAQSPLPDDREERFELMLGAFYSADASIRACRAGDAVEMGATVVAALISPGELLHLYAGDARLYHLRDGKIVYRTRDHSVVQVMIDAGALTADEAEIHPMRSLVTSCLGGPGAIRRLTIDPPYNRERIEARTDSFFGGSGPFRGVASGDRIVLCSDGLWSEVDERELAELFTDDDDPNRLTQEAVDRALVSGGEDNISVILIPIVSPGAKPTDTTQIESLSQIDRRRGL